MTITEPICNYLMRVGMSSHQSRNLYPFNVLNSTILLILVIDIVSVVTYLIYGAANLKEYADTIYLIITVLSAVVDFAFVNWEMAKIIQFINNLEDIVNTRLINPTLKTIYTQTGEKIQKLVEIPHFVFIKINPACVTIPAFIDSFLTYFTTELGADAFVLPFPTMCFPFDVKNPFGYLIAVTMSFVIVTIVGLAVVSVIIIVIAPCLILIATTVDIKYGLFALNTSARTKEIHFDYFLYVYLTLGLGCRLANEFSEMVQFIFIAYFTWSIGSICLTMFAIIFELRDKAPNSIVFQSFILIIFSFGFVFLACEFGHKLSTAFEEINDEIAQMHWYRFPVKLSKMLPIVIESAQQPVYLRVFGSTTCGRGDFEGVVKLGFSYCMVLQKFEN